MILLDEVDLLIHSLKSETNFPIGSKEPVDLGVPEDSPDDDLELALMESADLSNAASKDSGAGEMWGDASAIPSAQLPPAEAQQAAEDAFGSPVDLGAAESAFGAPVDVGVDMAAAEDAFGSPVDAGDGVDSSAAAGAFGTPVVDSAGSSAGGTSESATAAGVGKQAETQPSSSTAVQHPGDQPQQDSTFARRPSRWDLPFHLLEAILAHSRGRVGLPGFHSTKESSTILKQVGEVISEGVRSLAL